MDVAVVVFYFLIYFTKKLFFGFTAPLLFPCGEALLGPNVLMMQLFSLV